MFAPARPPETLVPKENHMHTSATAHLARADTISAAPPRILDAQIKALPPIHQPDAASLRSALAAVFQPQADFEREKLALRHHHKAVFAKAEAETAAAETILAQMKAAHAAVASGTTTSDAPQELIGAVDALATARKAGLDRSGDVAAVLADTIDRLDRRIAHTKAVVRRRAAATFLGFSKQINRRYSEALDVTEDQDQRALLIRKKTHMARATAQAEAASKIAIATFNKTREA